MKVWPEHLLLLVFDLALTCAAQLWRRFVFYFQGYPWRLGLLLNPEVSDDETCGFLHALVILAVSRVKNVGKENQQKNQH